MQSKYPMIESYEVRFRTTMTLYNVIQAYDSSKDGSLPEAYSASMFRMNKLYHDLAKSNVQTRLNFAKLKLDYDIGYILVYENEENLSIQFSHAILKVKLFILI